MDEATRIGYIVGGGLKDNLRVRLTVPSQQVQEGAFVVIRSGDWLFYGLVTDLNLGATDARFADEQIELRIPGDLAGQQLLPLPYPPRRHQRRGFSFAWPPVRFRSPSHALKWHLPSTVYPPAPDCGGHRGNRYRRCRELYGWSYPRLLYSSMPRRPASPYRWRSGPPFPPVKVALHLRGLSCRRRLPGLKPLSLSLPPSPQLPPG